MSGCFYTGGLLSGCFCPGAFCREAFDLDSPVRPADNWSRGRLICRNEEAIAKDRIILQIFESSQESIQYKKPSVEKKFALNVGSLKIIRSEGGAPITPPILFECGLFFVQGPPSRRFGLVTGAELSV